MCSSSIAIQLANGWKTPYLDMLQNKLLLVDIRKINAIGYENSILLYRKTMYNYNYTLYSTSQL